MAVQRRLGVLLLLVVLSGCMVFQRKDDSRIRQLRRSLDYPVHNAEFEADGAPIKITFTDLQIAPEITSRKWVVFSSGSAGNEAYRISERTLANLNQDRELRWISMTGLEMTPSKGWSLFQVDGIEHLDLAATNVADSNTAFLRSGENLTFLDLSGTLIGDASLAHLVAHQNLAHLRLNGTNVSDQGLAELAAIQSLRRVELIDTQVTEKGRASYRVAGGQAEIVVEDAVGGVL